MTHHDQIMVSQMLSHDPKVSHSPAANEGTHPAPRRNTPDDPARRKPHKPTSQPAWALQFLRNPHPKVHRGNSIVSWFKPHPIGQLCPGFATPHAGVPEWVIMARIFIPFSPSR